MTFFERYEQLCLKNGYKPASDQAAQVLGTNRGTISAWKTSGNPPRTEYLVAIADAYGVSTDYLLCRTDDPTDYSNPELAGAKKAAPQQKGTATEKTKSATQEQAQTMYEQLDEIDRAKVDGFIQGLLAQSKYTAISTKNQKRA